jgi:hypothetical protein
MIINTCIDQLVIACLISNLKGRATDQAVSRRFPLRRPGFVPASGHMGFMTDKVALGRVFSEYFGFPCRLSFQQLLQIYKLSYHRRCVGLFLKASLNKQLIKTDEFHYAGVFKTVYRYSLEGLVN